MSGGLLGLFAHHVVGELCQNLRDRIHQSRNRKSSADSGYCLTACSLSLCTVSKQALGVYRFRTMSGWVAFRRIIFYVIHADNNLEKHHR